MTVFLSPVGGAGAQFFDNNGNPLTGGKLYTYAAGTTTPQATYTSAAGSVFHTNPIILDAAGRVSGSNEIWLSVGQNYKFVLKDSNDVLLATWDQIGDIATNASVVTYDPPFNGSVSTTVETKLAQTVSVLDFGADPTGTNDSTMAIQAAVNASSRVFFPSGTYLVNVVTLDENTMLFGEGASSIIKQSASFVGGGQGSLYVNSGSAGAQVSNIVIRDLRIEGNNISNPTFSEFKHLVSLNGVQNALVENVQFVGFQGDGLYIGSGTSGGDERHNTNVVVKNCFFDGVNKENRNGISVIDCDGFLAEGNYFTRTTKSTMPGAIDIEPDAQVFHVIKDIKVVNNKFYNTGGNVGVISVVLPGIIYSVPPRGFLIDNNYIEDCAAAGVFFSYGVIGGLTEATSDFSIKVTNNIIKNSVNPFYFPNAKDLLVCGNSFLGAVSDAILSYNDGNSNVLDCKIVNNFFKSCGSTGAGNGLSIFKCSRVDIKGNTFNDCGSGVPGSANAIIFGSSSVSSYVSLVGNTFVSPDAKTLIAVQVESTHTLSPSTNTYLDNTTGSLTVNFVADNNDYAERSYSPVVTGSSSAGTGTYTVQYGRWRRIGKLVFFRVELAVSAGHTGSGMIQVGLPTLAVSAPNNEQTTVALVASGVSTTGGHIGLINPALVVGGNGAIRCYYNGTGTLSQMLIPAGAFTVNVSGFYQSA